MNIEFYKPDKNNPNFGIVSRVLRIKIWRLEVIFYWYY